jgi:hypothetical protein
VLGGERRLEGTGDGVGDGRGHGQRCYGAP